MDGSPTSDAGDDIFEGRNVGPEAARKHSLTVAEVKGLEKERFLTGAENALRSKPRDDDGMKEDQIKKLK